MSNTEIWFHNKTIYLVVFNFMPGEVVMILKPHYLASSLVVESLLSDVWKIKIFCNVRIFRHALVFPNVNDNKETFMRMQVLRVGTAVAIKAWWKMAFEGLTVYLSRDLVALEQFDELHNTLKSNGADLCLDADPSSNSLKQYHVISSLYHVRYFRLFS